MTYAVRLGETAESDLRDIYEYVAYEIGDPEVAARLVRRFRKATEGLSTFDERNHLVEQEPWHSRMADWSLGCFGQMADWSLGCFGQA